MERGCGVSRRGGVNGNCRWDVLYKEKKPVFNKKIKKRKKEKMTNITGY